MLQTYLTKFESEASLVSFIQDEVVQWFNKIMQFFTKENVFQEAGSGFKLVNIDVAKKENRMKVQL